MWLALVEGLWGPIEHMASEGLWELTLLANEAGVVAQSMCVGLGAGWGGSLGAFLAEIL